MKKLNGSFGCEEFHESPTQTPDESPNASPNQKSDESPTPNHRRETLETLGDLHTFEQTVVDLRRENARLTNTVAFLQEQVTRYSRAADKRDEQDEQQRIGHAEALKRAENEKRRIEEAAKQREIVRRKAEKQRVATVNRFAEAAKQDKARISQLETQLVENDTEIQTLQNKIVAKEILLSAKEAAEDDPATTTEKREGRDESNCVSVRRKLLTLTCPWLAVVGLILGVLFCLIWLAAGVGRINSRLDRWDAGSGPVGGDPPSVPPIVASEVRGDGPFERQQATQTYEVVPYGLTKDINSIVAHVQQSKDTLECRVKLSQ